MMCMTLQISIRKPSQCLSYHRGHPTCIQLMEIHDHLIYTSHLVSFSSKFYLLRHIHTHTHTHMQRILDYGTLYGTLVWLRSIKARMMVKAPVHIRPNYHVYNLDHPWFIRLGGMGRWDGCVGGGGRLILGCEIFAYGLLLTGSGACTMSPNLHALGASRATLQLPLLSLMAPRRP